MNEPGTVRIHPDNQASAAAWNDADGAHWVAWADTYDHALADHTAALLRAAAIRAGEDVLDVGCGSAHLTVEAGRRARPGRAVGIDVSRPLLDDARARARATGATNVELVLGDAQVHPFEAGSFEVLLSRTGTMFFADQEAAFANLATAAAPGGRLALVVWAGIESNAWFREINDALDAGRPPARPPAGAPGPFVFARPEHARDVLEGAGWIDVEPVEHHGPMWFGPSAESAYAFVSTQGSTRFRLSELDADRRSGALDALRTTLERHETVDGVVFDSAVWVITARRR